MKKQILAFLILTLLVFTACQKENSKIEEYSDDDALITAIQNASDKQIIEPGKLPDASLTVLKTDYIEDYVQSAKLANGLGYEIELRCADGPYAGERNQAYFDIKGRHLEAKNHGDENNDGMHGKKRCFVLILPVTFNMPDGTEITIEEKDDWALIKAWYEDHPDSNEKPIMQYPVDIKFRDGTIKTINNETAMRRAIKFCKGHANDHDKKCFSLLFPVTYTMPDGSEITLESKEDRALIKQWYADHPGVNEKPSLNFPVEIKYKDGTIVTINDAQELREARKNCNDDGYDKRCFRLVLPVTYIMPDGSEIVVSEKEDYALIKEWYFDHPDVAEKPSLEYPVNIAYFDNDAIVTINSKEEMMAAKEACKDDQD